MKQRPTSPTTQAQLDRTGFMAPSVIDSSASHIALSAGIVRIHLDYTLNGLDLHICKQLSALMLAPIQRVNAC